MTVEYATAATGIYDFLNAFVRDGNVRAAWTHVDPLLRLCWAQGWAYPILPQLIASGYNPDSVVETFATDQPSHPLWPQFEKDCHDIDWFNPDGHTWATTRAMSPVAPDVVQFGLIPNSSRDDPPTGESVAAFTFVMRFNGERWRVLNFFGSKLPEPGWPPTLR